jgi:hypothetical protein
MGFFHNFLHAARYEGLFEENPSQLVTPVTLRGTMAPWFRLSFGGSRIAQIRQSTLNSDLIELQNGGRK